MDGIIGRSVDETINNLGRLSMKAWILQTRLYIKLWRNQGRWLEKWIRKERVLRAFSNEPVDRVLWVLVYARRYGSAKECKAHWTITRHVI